MSVSAGEGVGVGANRQAHHLVKMRVAINPQTPTSPITPIALPTPYTTRSCLQEESVMEDLQLAAELGKTLLERNRELENVVKQQQAVIDDQVQEIEYLNKQTTALKEVNDSRLRIYEQLEVSIQELEKNNQRLGAENSADKRKIKSLTAACESLESKNEDLQKQLDEAQSNNDRGRNKKKTLISEEALARRSMSCENSPKAETESQSDDVMVKNYILELEAKLKDAQTKLTSETKKREDVEIELSCLTQANGVFQEQLSVLREKQLNLHSLEEELASIDDDSSARLCSKCLGCVEDTGSNATIYDLNDIEDTDMSIESTHGECALVKLKNGGYAWGSQESLASMGRVLSRVGSNTTSPGADNLETPHNSLLFELDTQYRILIEKYEALLAAREHQQLLQQESLKPLETNESGPSSVGCLMNHSSQDTSLSLKCQKCSTCSCNLNQSSIACRPKSTSEEFSEAETSSSGFSDGENKLSTKFTQTELDECQEIFDEAMTPTPAIANRCLDLTSPLNPCDKRFQATPEYKKLFQEIFTVLKKNVEENTEKKTVINKPQFSLLETNVPKDFAAANNKPCKTSPLNEISNTMPTQQPLGSSSNKSEKIDTSDSVTPTSEEIPNVISENKQKENVSESGASPSFEICEKLLYSKPPRPDSLDLISNSSRSSSKGRRKRRNQRRRMENIQNQSQHQSRNENQESKDQHAKKSFTGQNNPTKDELPILQNNSTYNDRIVYPSNRGGCEHHRSRKNRHSDSHYSNNSKYQNHSNYPYDQPSGSHSKRYQQNSISDGSTKPSPTKSKIVYPSVEVARLRKLEMSYAQVLKNALNRPYNSK